MDGKYLERFMNRIDTSGDCWIWTAGRTASGYGLISVGPHQQVYAHRASYEHFIGPIPDGLEVTHLCNIPPCVNPDHLRAGTHAENMAYAKECGRSARVVGNNFRRGKSHLLDDAKVYAILGDTRSQSVIAAEYGISVSAVKGIRQRHKWTHVTPPPGFVLRPVGHPRKDPYTTT